MALATMSYRIAQLTPADVPALKALLQVFGEAFHDAHAYGRAVPSDAYLQSLLARPHFIVLVATNDDEVIGGLAAYELEKSSRIAARSISTIWQCPNSIAGKGSLLSSSASFGVSQLAARPMSSLSRPTGMTFLPSVCTSHWVLGKKFSISILPCRCDSQVTV